MGLSKTSIIQANWPAPPHIEAFTTTRFGGVSAPPYDQLNLGFHVGDKTEDVDQNVDILEQYLGDGQVLRWLNQTHSTRVVDVQSLDSQRTTADAVYTDREAQVCAVLTADCLPILLSTIDGEEIAAVHAGWRGLAAGIAQRTIERFKQPATQIIAWLGPAIGPQAFEVGEDVRQSFTQQLSALCPPGLIEQGFAKRTHHQGKYFADLYHLARIELLACGLAGVYGGGLCTYTDPRFYSYRRDHLTGRMASLIVRRQ